MPDEQPQIWSVSQLTRRVKSILETQVSYVWVSGEISNWRVSPAGHAYFTLKDENSQIDAVMFRGKLMGVRFGPENGLEVNVFGMVTVYEKRGNYQIICDEMQPKGMGALQVAFEKLKKKLAAEGLFDEAHKKPIPMLPRRVGVVTSPTGAAIQDILNVIGRRFANVHVILSPARVQGEEAADDLVEAIRLIDAWGVDVMIVGRGGGSMEDLWPFNEEKVVRAVYETQTPVISAVGHEIDFTLTDFAADMRAPTPSAAAELVVQERAALVQRVRQLSQRLAKSAKAQMSHARHRLDLARSSYVLRRPDDLFREQRMRTDELRERMETAMDEQVRAARTRVDKAGRALALLSPVNQVQRARERFASARARLTQTGPVVMASFRGRLGTLAAKLDALSPVAILSRGYALARRLPGRELVRDSAQLTPGDRVLLTFGTGGATATVDGLEETDHG